MEERPQQGSLGEEDVQSHSSQFVLLGGSCSWMFTAAYGLVHQPYPACAAGL